MLGDNGTVEGISLCKMLLWIMLDDTIILVLFRSLDYI